MGNIQRCSYRGGGLQPLPPWNLGVQLSLFQPEGAEYAHHITPQIREQMSGPEFFQYGKSILGSGLWPMLDRGKKGSGPILSNFFGWFFHFFVVKKIFQKFFENTIASALKSYIIIL